MKHFNFKFAIITIFVIIVLAVSSSALSDANTTAIYGTVKIDGIIDDIWDKATKKISFLLTPKAILEGIQLFPQIPPVPFALCGMKTISTF